MASSQPLVVPLAGAATYPDAAVGGKAVKLASLIGADYRVPDGFCITANAYDAFVTKGELARTIQMELERKSFSEMRWEEIWDAALRIRSAFLATPVPDTVKQAIAHAYESMAQPPVAVRSSAPGEDAVARSYAGLHESLLGIAGTDALFDAVRVVWASLWSDAALLYRQELKLDPLESKMAVVVQEIVTGDRSGVGFGRDPRYRQRDRQIVEAVPGPCSNLVDGIVDPDRWIMKRSTGEIIEWRPGERTDSPSEHPLLERRDLEALHAILCNIEELLGWPPDIEWTGNADNLTLLQARPITTLDPEPLPDKRQWYLSLRPGMKRLEKLRRRVVDELIPQLESEGHRFAREQIESRDNSSLADALRERAEALRRWKQIYWDEFIPFAHGVRQLAVYYNDAVKPADPYEFTGLLKAQSMIASKRNAALEQLAGMLRRSRTLRNDIRDLVQRETNVPRTRWPELRTALGNHAAAQDFSREFEHILDTYMDIAYSGERIGEHIDQLLHTLLELAEAQDQREGAPGPKPDETVTLKELEQRLLDAVGPERHAEARAVIETGRLSWRLRDDDNILVGRVEDQLFRALHLAAGRLIAGGRLSSDALVTTESANVLADALENPDSGPVRLPVKSTLDRKSVSSGSTETPRQIVGQPASPGLVTGRARVVRTQEDLGRFKAGEILVCDAIQPTMSHLVPLCAAIVERRGGMLIHGAIIARELGIPCVNGVSDIIGKLRDGDLLTVDGHLGIVTVGPPEFDLESAFDSS